MARLERGANLLAGLIAEDIAAYDLWRKASKMDPKDPATAQQKQLALTAALAIPSQILATCAACLRDMAALAPLSSKYLWTDLAGAAHMTLASAEAAAWTVYANLGSPDLAAEEQARVREEVQHQQEEANRACREVIEYVRGRCWLGSKSAAASRKCRERCRNCGRGIRCCYHVFIRVNPWQLLPCPVSAEHSSWQPNCGSRRSGRWATSTTSSTA